MGKRAEKPLSEGEILKRIAEGESLRSICASAGMAESTVRGIFQSDEQLAAQYARARESQAHHYADRLVDEAMSASDPAIGRLRMDALKWAAGKILPKAYGDKVQVGGDPDGAPIKHAMEVIFVKADGGRSAS